MFTANFGTFTALLRNISALLRQFSALVRQISALLRHFYGTFTANFGRRKLNFGFLAFRGSSLRSRAKANETIITMRMAAEGCPPSWPILVICLWALALDFILGSFCNFMARFRYFYSPIPGHEVEKTCTLYSRPETRDEDKRTGWHPRKNLIGGPAGCTPSHCYRKPPKSNHLRAQGL